MGSPAKKEKFERPKSNPFEFDAHPNEVERFHGLIQNAKDFFYNLLGKRKHRRRHIDFTSSLRVFLMVDKRKIEVIPVDIGKGGVGLRVPGQHLKKFQVEQLVQVELSFRQTDPIEMKGEVRYLLQGDTHGTLGLKFKNVPEGFVKTLRSHGIK